MYNVETILSLLNEGQSADDIAKSFTEMLNKAVQEKKKEETLKSQKLIDMKGILEDILLYINTYFPNVLPEVKEIEDKDVNEIMKAFDEIVPELETIAGFLRSAPVRKVKITPSSKVADDIIKDFLKLHNL